MWHQILHSSFTGKKASPTAGEGCSLPVRGGEHFVWEMLPQSAVLALALPLTLTRKAVSVGGWQRGHVGSWEALAGRALSSLKVQEGIRVATGRMWELQRTTVCLRVMHRMRGRKSAGEEGLD